jgi:hypothetical protein
MNFCYNKYNNSIYCLLSNKFMYCKSLNWFGAIIG